MRLKELRDTLTKRHYPDFIINKGIERATKLDVATLRTPKDRINDNNIITFINTYSPNQTNIYNIFHQNKDFLISSDSFLKDVFKDTKFINSRKQGPSLKRILTRAKFSSTVLDSNEPMVQKCGKTRCLLCNEIQQTSNYNFHKVNFQFNVKTRMNCESRNVIYVLTCNGCNEYYIGETQYLRSRTNLHRSHIKNPSVNSLFVSQHIFNCAKEEPKYKMFPFFKMSTENKFDRLMKEKHFIDKYKPSLNR